MRQPPSLLVLLIDLILPAWGQGATLVEYLQPPAYYEYYWKSNWKALPWPIAHCLQEDVPWYHQRGHQGVYTQYTATNEWTLFPAYYVAARLLWDVETDVDATVAKMHDDLFAAAAEPMKRYYALMEEQMAKAGHFSGNGTANGLRVFTPEVRAKLRACWEEAGQLNQDPVVARRLAKVGLSLDYTDCVAECPRLRAEPAAALVERMERLLAHAKRDPDAWRGVHSPLAMNFMRSLLLQHTAGKPIGRRHPKWRVIRGEWRRAAEVTSEHLTEYIPAVGFGTQGSLCEFWDLTVTESAD